jgi:hypothetical protein
MYRTHTIELWTLDVYGSRPRGPDDNQCVFSPVTFLPGNLEGGGGGKEIINARLLLSVSLFLRAKGRKKKKTTANNGDCRCQAAQASGNKVAYVYTGKGMACRMEKLLPRSDPMYVCGAG